MSRKPARCSNPPRAKSAKVIDDRLHVRLVDGRELSVPLDRYRTLRLAPKSARNRVKLVGSFGIDWPNLSFDLGVESLVHVCKKISGCTITSAKPKR